MLAALIAFALVSRPNLVLANASREDKSGWLVLHLSGKPREVGYQYGALAATEIEDAHMLLRECMKRETGHDWEFFRNQSKDLYWSKVPDEYQQEMEGQAEGLASKGVKLDVWDVLAYNAYIEFSGYYLPWKERNGSNTKESCSAFVATNSYTKSGKIVMGHSLWWDYPLGQRFRAVLDIKPQQGQRLVMDALVGFIHSGSDFAINSAGIMLCETTISGFHGYDPSGVPEFVRMRKAIQYSKSLDDVVRIFKDGNNGGYANTWLLGDTKKNEIGKLELGLKNVEFVRTTDGTYYGANYPESPKLIAEETYGFSPDPKFNGCMKRKARWATLTEKNKGQIDAAKAKAFLGDTYDEISERKGATGSTLCGRSLFGYPSGAVNAKVATSESVAKMSFDGCMGFPDGASFEAEPYLKQWTGLSWLKPYLKDIPVRPYVALP